MAKSNLLLSSQFNAKSPTLLLKLNHLLRLCSDSKSLNQCQQIHQQITVSGSHQDPFTVTKLIQVYGDCDDLYYAQKLFDRLPHPNVFAWTSIFGFYARHGAYEKCIATYGLMKFRGVLPDGYVFPKVLKSCAQLLWIEGGFWVHKDVIVRGCEFNLQVCNSLIDMYTKCGDVGSAKWVFEEMGYRDLCSWNSMISGYVCNGLLDLAVELFDCLRLGGFEPDIVTLNTLVDAYCRKGLCDEAWQVFKQIEEPSIISWTTLISGYSRVGNHETSLRIFKEMVSRGMVFPDSDSLSTAVVSCRHLQAFMGGKEIHGYGIKREDRTVFYSSAGAALLTMYAKCHNIQYARNVFESMNKSDVVTWNAMIFGFVELELGNMALECFSKMQRLGIKNNETTISTVLPVCDLHFGEQIHAYIAKSSLSLVVSVCNALIHMYCKCGCIRSAFSVFSDTATKDVVSWNAMVGGFAMHGHGQAALHLLLEMKQCLQPDSMTFIAALSACSHSGLVDEGLKFFLSMTEEHELTPSMEHYSCIVDMLARAGRLEDALSFIRRMPIEPNKSIWGTLLAACRAQQNVNVGRLAAEELVRLEPERAGHYVTLSNLYASTGRWDDSLRVRKDMKGRGLIKPSGESWIGVGH